MFAFRYTGILRYIL